MKKCPSCGNLLDDNASFCSSCGQNFGESTQGQSQQNNNQQQAYNNPQQQPYNNNQQQPVYNNGQMDPSTSKATVSLVLSIVSFFCCGIILAIVSLVMSTSYLKNPMSNPAGFSSARAAKIISIISLVLYIVVIVTYIILIAFGVTYNSYLNL